MIKKFSSIKEFKPILVENLKNSTIHGLPNFIRTNRKSLKILWSICFFISSGFCAYIVLESIVSYMNYGVVTTFRVFNEPTSEFPAIMLCNKNNFENDFYEELLNNSILNQTSINDYENKNFNDVQLKLYNMRIKISSYLMSKTLRERKKKSIEIEKNLISCNHLNEICDSNNFTWFFHFIYGNCYVLYGDYNSNGNWESPKLISQEDYFTALKLELFIGEPSKFEALSSSLGYQLFILNRSDHYNKFNSIDLSPGKEYNIMLDRTFLKQLPKPYSICEFNEQKAHLFESPFIKIMNEMNITYSRTACVDLCYQELVFKKCDCIDYTIDARLESKFCSSDKEISCANDFYYFEFSKSDFIETNCDPYCPIECEKVSISPIISFSKYPSDKYFEILKQNKNLQERVFKNSSMAYVKKSILKINIYYQTLSYTLISEEAKILMVDLLSSIGGTFLFKIYTVCFILL